MKRKEVDIIGIALKDAYSNASASQEQWAVWVNGVEDQPMPVSLFFRSYHRMKKYEKIALAHCRGKVLDLGAGAGAHALVLQKRGFSVSALESSKGACDIMRQRGVEKVINGSWQTLEATKFDTALALMNGTGLAGTLDQFPIFLRKIKKQLNVGGQLLIDSTDISYFFEEHNMPIHAAAGEVTYELEYKGSRGKPFQWLYLDQATMKKAATKCGFQSQVLFESDDTHYLARLVKA